MPHDAQRRLHRSSVSRASLFAFLRPPFTRTTPGDGLVLRVPRAARDAPGCYRLATPAPPSSRWRSGDVTRWRRTSAVTADCYDARVTLPTPRNWQGDSPSGRLQG